MTHLDIDDLVCDFSHMNLKEPSFPTFRPAWNPSVTYKTKMCKFVMVNGVCRYGDKCIFAHSMDELRMPAYSMDTMRRNINYKYKTKPCNKYHRYGFCPYGDRCLFVHGPDETQSSRKIKCSCMCEEHQHLHKNVDSPHHLSDAMEAQHRADLNTGLSMSPTYNGMSKKRDNAELLNCATVMGMLSFLE
uniref:C3H1-type domain-containing protein n=1 Tax=Steinernema glaseri TaxID=37863 RepID=A0A1I7YZY9_9BILA